MDDNQQQRLGGDTVAMSTFRNGTVETVRGGGEEGLGTEKRGGRSAAMLVHHHRHRHSHNSRRQRKEEPETEQEQQQQQLNTMLAGQHNGKRVMVQYA